MTHACPKCTRPNAQGRVQCLYCGEELPQSEISHGDLCRSPRLIKRAGRKTFLVTLLPAKNDEPYQDDMLNDMAMARLQEKFDTDFYQIKQWLKLRGLKVIKSFPERGKSEELAKELRQWGFRGLSIANEDLNQLGYSFRAKSAELNGEMKFLGENKESILLDPEQNYLLVKGRIQVEKNNLSSHKAGKKDDDGLSSFDGELGGEIDSLDYFVFDLFCEGEDKPALRVKSSAFDFACLGDKTTNSSLINMNQLITTLQIRCPNLIVDDSFGLVMPVATDSKFAGLFDPTVKHISGNLKYKNNEPQFDQYARIVVYLHRQNIDLPQGTLA